MADTDKITTTLKKFPQFEKLFSKYNRIVGVKYHIVCYSFLRNANISKNQFEEGIIDIIVKFRGLSEFYFRYPTSKDIVDLLENGMRIVGKHPKGFGVKHVSIAANEGFEKGTFKACIPYIVRSTLPKRPRVPSSKNKHSQEFMNGPFYATKNARPWERLGWDVTIARES